MNPWSASRSVAVAGTTRNGLGPAIPSPPPPPASPSIPGGVNSPFPGGPAAGLHVRARASQQDLDDDGGVRPPQSHRGRVHDRGRAPPPARPPCDLPHGLSPLARPRAGSVV